MGERQGDLRFLKIVHLGLILYLILHSIFIPFVRYTQGTDNLLNEGLLSLSYHCLLFVMISNYDKWEWTVGVFPYYVFWGVFNTIINFIFTYFVFFNGKLEHRDFSEIVAIFSSLIFFVILYSKFRNLFLWKYRFWVLNIIIAFTIITQNFINVAIQKSKHEERKLIRVQEEKSSTILDSYGCKGSVIKGGEIPISQNSLDIIDCGFSHNFLKEKSNLQDFSVKNKRDKNAYLRIYAWEGKKVEQVKRIVIKHGAEFSLPSSFLRKYPVIIIVSKVSPELGISAIVQEEFKQIDFEITPNYVMIKGVKYEY